MVDDVLYYGFEGGYSYTKETYRTFEKESSSGWFNFGSNYIDDQHRKISNGINLKAKFGYNLNRVALINIDFLYVSNHLSYKAIELNILQILSNKISLIINIAVVLLYFSD